jgi:hypothetical protein
MLGTAAGYATDSTAIGKAAKVGLQLLLQSFDFFSALSLRYGTVCDKKKACGHKMDCVRCFGFFVSFASCA